MSEPAMPQEVADEWITLATIATWDDARILGEYPTLTAEHLRAARLYIRKHPDEVASWAIQLPVPEPSSIPMLLWCPMCHERHVDVGEFATKLHHTHACQGCGHCWRPAIVPTVGVQFLPGFKDP